MTGRRVYGAPELPWLEPGDYGFECNGVWYACTPNGLLANLEKHAVVEHRDKTISVSPSILVRGFNFGATLLTWHGYLENGTWREC